MLQQGLNCLTAFFILVCFLRPAAQSVSLESGEVLAPPEAQVLNIPMQFNLASLEPDQANNFWQYMILDMVLEPLVRFDEAQGIAPAAAESWMANTEKTIWQFRLRPEGKWSNGDPVTAHDFVRTYQNYCDPDIRKQINAVFFDLFPLKNAKAVFNRQLPMEALGVRALKDDLLELTFEGPIREKWLFTTLAHPMFAPTHLRFLQAIREKQSPSTTYRNRHGPLASDGNPLHLKDELAQNPKAELTGSAFVSNGPFVITDLCFGSVVRAKKNPYYWDANCLFLQKVNWHFTTFSATEFWQAAVEKDFWNLACTRDIAPCPKPLRQKVFEEWGTYHIPRSTQATDLFVLNTRCHKLQAHGVRCALDMLLNREAIVEWMLAHSTSGQQIDIQNAISYSLFPSKLGNMSKYRPDFADWTAKKRYKEGEFLLRAAGYTAQKPLILKLTWVDQGEVTGALLDLIGTKLFLSPLIQLDSDRVPASGLLPKLRAGDFDIMLGRCNCLGPAPESLFKVFKSSSYLGQATGLPNPAYDALVDQVIDPARPYQVTDTNGYEKLRDAEAILMQEHTLLPFAHTKNFFVFKRDVRGVPCSNLPGGYPDLRYLYIVCNPAISPPLHAGSMSDDLRLCDEYTPFILFQSSRPLPGGMVGMGQPG